MNMISATSATILPDESYGLEVKFLSFLYCFKGLIHHMHSTKSF